MREEILPPELRQPREDLDGFGDLAPHDADAPDVPLNFPRPVLMDLSDTEDLRRTLVAFRRVAHRREEARHHEILMLVALVLLVLVTILKFLWPYVSGQSG